MQTYPALGAADILSILDAQGAALKAGYVTLGTDAPGETTTLADKMADAYAAIMGISCYALESQLSGDALANVGAGRWDVMFFRLSNIFRIMDSYTLQSLESAPLSMQSSDARPLDLWSRRLNGSDPGAPAKPVVSGVTLSPTTGGMIPSCTSGNAPRVVLTYFGANDWQESQPSAELAQVALSGANSAYTLAGLPGTVPTGVTRVGVYRGYISGLAGTYYLDQIVDVTAGAAFPTITLKNADSVLREDIAPPSWASCLWLPEGAMCYALSRASYSGGPVTFGSTALPGPDVVAMNPSNAFTGFNPPADAIFGTHAVGSAYAAGAPRLASDYANRLQGYAGATKLQARVTSALDAPATLTNIVLTYLDAAHPATPQTTTIAGPFTLAAAEGSVVEITGLPTGALVQSVTGDSIAGAASGALLYEAKAARTI